jgi:4-hydroxy-tetrahydrodipicolinate reductase
MIRIAVAGGCGRMGRQLAEEILGNPGASLAGVFERPGHPDLGKNYGSLLGRPEVKFPVSDSLESIIKETDAVIDFTAPEATLKNAALVSKLGKVIVIGTTGLTAENKTELTRLSSTCRLLVAGNMSLGVNVLLKVVTDVAKLLGPEYDIEIMEAHHNQKKDAPSGTALALAEAISQGIKKNLKDVALYGREGLVGARKKGEIAIHAVRGGDIVGEHTVMFAGPGEKIEIKHTASNRRLFALGALRAALWLAKKPNGWYTMMDVLGLK